MVLDGQGNLYGTTSGGAACDGTVFEIVKGSKTITTLASFNGTNGANPLGSLVLDGQGNLYGTTSGGGASGDGTVFELKPSNPIIAATSPTWNSTDGGVDYGYTISSAALPQATTVDLDWASGTTVNTIIGTITSTTTTTAQGSYQLHATPSQLGTPPAGATYLLVVADPGNLISPADPSKVASLALTSIIATTPKWNTTNGGVDYGYSIGSAGLPQATTVDLDWASGTTVDIVIGSPIISTTTATAQGTYQLHATPSQLGTPPAGATYLLVVADPGNLVSPADPSKVASLALTGIIATTPKWNTTDGGVDYGYTIGSAGLPQATTVDLDWASGTTVDTVSAARLSARRPRRPKAPTSYTRRHPNWARFRRGPRICSSSSTRTTPSPRPTRARSRPLLSQTSPRRPYRSTLPAT